MVLDSFEQMKGKTVIGVIEVGFMKTAFINEGTILVMDRQENDIISKDRLTNDQLFLLMSETGITVDQLL
jgi:hypothetical protein